MDTTARCKADGRGWSMRDEGGRTATKSTLDHRFQSKDFATRFWKSVAGAYLRQSKV